MNKKMFTCFAGYILENNNCVYSATITTIPSTIPSTIPTTILTTIPNIMATTIINYYISKDLNQTNCPEEYPYYNVINNNCF